MRRREALERQSQIWKSLPRNNADEIRIADDFYDNSVFPIVAEIFQERYRLKAEGVPLMFVTVGTSWQPIALSILCNKPDKVVFLCTEDTCDNAKKVALYLKREIKNSVLEEVEKASSCKLIHVVRKWFDQERPVRCRMDITGGTKAMAAAAGMVADQLRIPVCYIESDYLPVYRHPNPGSERLVSLDLPE